MKALLLSAIVFFSLRATAVEVGEDQKSSCPSASQSSSRAAKVVIDSGESDKKEVQTSISK